MPRIRTIKPEFWTDETIVQLPFEARLLFIGMWSFADDQGALDDSPDRIRMQIFPNEPGIDITALIDLLAAANLLEYYIADGGGRAIVIRNWAKHQKIDNPSRKSIIREGYRKLSITGDIRIGVALKYDAQPGVDKEAECYYCGAKGKIHWWIGNRGRPTKWVYLSNLEFDHFKGEQSGGENSKENIVLACQQCNRAKREFDPIQFFHVKNSLPSIEIPSEPSIGVSPRARAQDQGPGTKEGTKEGKNTYPTDTQASPADGSLTKVNYHSPSQPTDLHKAYYDTGIAYLAQFGKDEISSRKLLGLWSRDLGGFGQAGQVLAQAQTIGSPDPVGYMQGACEKQKKNRNAARTTANGHSKSETYDNVSVGTVAWYHQQVKHGIFNDEERASWARKLGIQQ